MHYSTYRKEIKNQKSKITHYKNGDSAPLIINLYSYFISGVRHLNHDLLSASFIAIRAIYGKDGFLSKSESKKLHQIIAEHSRMRAHI
ncbi:MAG: hypothetical protein HOI31_07325 [Gammaproteobacteria bacterium]|nr:hypothetical protein [Gammaproteobacteria bacterium]